MDESRYIIRRAAKTLVQMKNAKLDEPTANELHRLINKDELETNHLEEERIEIEEDVDEVLPIHENTNAKISGFGVNPEFIRKLKCGEIKIESLTLPPLRQSIDGIDFPKIPPIKNLREQIDICSDPFEKQLTTTDLDDGQGRLSFCKMAVEKLLKPILKTSDDLKMGIDVTVYNEKGKGFPMSFKFWSDKMHVLTMGWKIFCSENELKACEDWVTIWMFRKTTEELCFVIIPRRFPITKLIGKAQKKGSKSVVKKEKGKENKFYSSSSQD